MTEKTPLCPYCGAAMRRALDENELYYYVCTNTRCGSTAPSAGCSDEALEAALHRCDLDKLTDEEREATALDWDHAEEYLKLMISEYATIGPAGFFGLKLVLWPLKERFDAGERTKKLFDEIMEVE